MIAVDRAQHLGAHEALRGLLGLCDRDGLFADCVIYLEPTRSSAAPSVKSRHARRRSLRLPREDVRLLT